jgi:hypothetical protein
MGRVMAVTRLNHERVWVRFSKCFQVVIGSKT